MYSIALKTDQNHFLRVTTEMMRRCKHLHLTRKVILTEAVATSTWRNSTSTKPRPLPCTSFNLLFNTRS